ncbi:TPA_asm: hypothetical protein [Hydra MELD virus]|nr:TPA_asm: hypothetical protein [Hydra MELD virus]
MIKENEMVIWVKEIVNKFNAVKMLKCELLNEQERVQIKNAFRQNVCLEIKNFIKEYIYPFPTYDQNGKFIQKRLKKKEKNQIIYNFVKENSEALYAYFNSASFKLYSEIINYYSNKLTSFETHQPTNNVIELLREQYDSN